MSDVNGTWNAKAQTPMGEQDVVIELVQDGNSVSGTISARGKQVCFSDGTINGDDFACQVKAKGIKAKVSGTVSGDTMSGKVKIPLATIKFEGARA